MILVSTVCCGGAEAYVQIVCVFVIEKFTSEKTMGTLSRKPSHGVVGYTLLEGLEVFSHKKCITQ
eukprot:5130818-Amphidinium_carterae.1